jgi:hypothetical protein
MEIGPVTGVRAVSLLSAQRVPSSHSPIFEIDPSARAGDETYFAGRQTPKRGLEEEDSDAPEEDDADLATMPFPNHPRGGINCFA